MNTAEQILVVFLSTALAVLLVLAIVAVAFIMSLVKKLNNIAAKAEHFADSAEAAGEAIRKTASNLRVLNFLRVVMDAVQGKGSTKRKKDEGEE